MDPIQLWESISDDQLLCSRAECDGFLGDPQVCQLEGEYFGRRYRQVRFSQCNTHWPDAKVTSLSVAALYRIFLGLHNQIFSLHLHNHSR
jgi:hypothetical protein